MIATFRQRNGIRPRNFGPDEILDRALGGLVTEALMVLDEKIAARASDIDVVFVNG
ncbi:MAG: hypothetical protein ACRC14_00445 [Paracoccaceae bacterium]